MSHGRIARMVRLGWLALGCLCVALGIIGAMVPLMPTTIFLILAAGCFTRSSPRLESWLLDHPRFGTTLRAWRRDGAISRKAKAMACGGMMLGYAAFLTMFHPAIGFAAFVALVMGSCGLYVLTRPTAPP